jgi:biopolymer transport protein ExbD
MSMDVGGSKSGPMASINVTPLADVMIVLLIIFMVITPMLAKGVDVKLPSANQTKEHQDKAKSVIVALLPNGKTQLNGKDVALTELPGLVKQRFESLGEEEKVLYLKADASLPYSDIMKVMDACREGGVEEVAFIAEKKVEG